MAKTLDVPREIREFNKLFQQLEYRQHAASVFSDYLDYFIYVLNTGRDESQIERIRSTYGKDYEIIVRMWHEHIAVQHAQVADGGWYDLLGTVYEAIVSRSKSSAMGQFFTPSTVCDFMASINGADESHTGKGLTVNDPACGSGRTLLAWHAKAPGNFMYGDDLDPMCTKMAAINLCIHGAQGQVSNTNSLTLDDWRFGYQINPDLYTKGMVSLRPITKEESFSWSMWKEPKPQPQKQPQPAPTLTISATGQANFLSLFDA